MGMPEPEPAKAPPVEGADAAEGEQPQEDEEAIVAEITLEVELPTGAVVTLPGLNKGEGGHGIRSALADLPETCFYSSYALVVKGREPRTEINEYVELTEYPFLQDGTRLKMVPEDYDVKRARSHVRRLKELLAYPPATPKAARAAAAAAAQEGAEEEEGQQAGSENGPAAANGAAVVKAEGAEEEGQGQGEQGEGEGGNGKEPEKQKELTREEIMAIREKLPKAPLSFPLQPALDQFYTTVMGPGAAPAKEVATPLCLRRLGLSAWNPPPAPRRVVGDLCYLEVETLDGAVLNITAIPSGFYVNRTQGDRFDPTPAASCHFAHELFTVLASAHPPFKKAWQAAVAASTERAKKYEAPLEVLASLAGEGKFDAHTLKQPWLVPQPYQPNGENKGSGSKGAAAAATADVVVGRHKADPARAEDDQLNLFGMEAGNHLRDWNEEYQSLREMEPKTPGEQIVRAKLLHKILTEFGDAALLGATAVVQGFVQPINPVEPRKNHVYVYNNIFFSFAADTPNTFKAISGDRPAFKGALHELRNLQHIAKLGIPASATGGLYTLATSVVDFLGARVVAQSIIPGILSGEQHSRLVYGSVEPGVKIKADEEFHSKLAELSKAFLLAERSIPVLPIRPGSAEAGDAAAGNEAKGEGEGEGDEKEGEEGPKTVRFIGPVEWKGIKGADGRCYMLDLLRLTPRDPNWIKEDWRHPSGSGTGVWERAGAPEGVPPLEDDTAAVLRPELIHLYVRTRVMTMRQKIVAEYQQRKLAERAAGKGKDSSKPEEEKAKPEGEEGAAAEEGKEKEAEAEEEEIALDEVTQQLLREEEEELMERLRINPNAFLPLEGVEDLDQVAKDEEQIRVLARFLWNEAIPAYLEQVKQGEMSALDGQMLTETLHQMGINIRYLGRLAALAKESQTGPAGATGVPTPTSSSSDTSKGGGAGEGGKAGDAGGVKEALEKRFRCPAHLVQLCEAEMAARAAKHVVFDLLKDRADLRAAPGPTVVAVLNAVLGGCGAGGSSGSGGAGGEAAASAPSSPEPVTAASGGGGKKKGKKGGKGGHHHGNGVASAALPAHATHSVPPPPGPPKTREELRALVLDDIKLRFRYASPTLLAQHASPAAQNLRRELGANAPAAAYWAVPNPNALLRRLCQKLGLRVAARAYDWTGPKPLGLGDLVDIQPIAKHSAPVQPCAPAQEMLDTARVLARQGMLTHAFEYAQEAAALFSQVVGPMCMETAKCSEVSATILFQAGDQEVALAQMEKALAIFWQVGGVDCFDAANAHHTLALFHASMRGHNAEAVRHFRACAYLLELIAGPDSPELPSLYQRLANELRELGLVQEAFAAQKAAYEKARQCPDPLMEAAHAHQLALMEAAFTLYKEALAHEKRAYAVYRELFGDGHPKTVETSLCMSAFTSKAVEAATSRSNQQRAALQAMQAAAVAGGGGKGKGGKSGGGAAAAGGDDWVPESMAGGGGAGAKKKKKGGKKK